MARPVVAGVSAAAVLAAAVGVVITFGVLSVPEFPAVADPGLRGTVAFTRYDHDATCVLVVAAAGGPKRELLCDESLMLSGWTDAGLIAVERWSAAPERLLIDPTDATVVSRRRLDHEAHEHPTAAVGVDRREDGATLAASAEDGEARLELLTPDGGSRVLLRASGPRDYAFHAPSWSPNGRHVVVTDSEQRVLVVDARTGETGVLVTDAADPAWAAVPPAGTGAP